MENQQKEEKEEVKEFEIKLPQPGSMMSQIQSIVLFKMLLVAFPFLAGLLWIIIAFQIKVSAAMGIGIYLNLVVGLYLLGMLYENYKGKMIQGKRFLEYVYRIGANWLADISMIDDDKGIDIVGIKEVAGKIWYSFIIPFVSEDFPRIMVISPRPIGENFEFKGAEVPWGKLLLGAQESCADFVHLDYVYLGSETDMCATPMALMLASDGHAREAQELAKKYMGEKGGLDKLLAKVPGAEVPERTTLQYFAQSWDVKEAARMSQENRVLRQEIAKVYEFMKRTGDREFRAVAALLEDLKLFGGGAKPTVMQKYFLTWKRRLLLIAAIGIAIAIVAVIVVISTRGAPSPQVP